MPPSRLNPTLFDKLVADLEMDGLRDEDAPEAGAEANRSTLRFYTVPRIERFNEAALRATVRRELNWLLNTTNLDAAFDLEAYPEVQTSVLNYGVPDLAGKSLTSRVIQMRGREIKTAIKTFEPRIDPGSLDVQPSVTQGERENAVTYVISGDVTAAVNAMPITFKTDVETDTGAATVRD